MWGRLSRLPRRTKASAIFCALAFTGIAAIALAWTPLRSVLWNSFWNSSSATDLPPIAPTLDEARHHFARGEFSQTEEIARNVLAAKPHDSAALLLAGEAATRQGKPEVALEYYDRIPAESGDDRIQGLWSSGGVLVHLGRMSESEARFREALKLDPKNDVAHRNLAFLLCASGRRYESLPHLMALLKLGVPTLEDLLFLGNPVHTVDHSEYLNFARQVAPHDPLPTLGIASVAMFHGKFAEAHDLLQHTLAHGPQLVEAHAMLGRYYVERNDAAAMRKWASSLTPEMQRHPEIWFVRGVWAQDHGDRATAIRSFWEALQRNPDHLRANYRLGQLLVAEGKADWARQFSERAQRQESLNRILTLLYSEGPRPDRMARAAKLTEELGRPWEAWAWNRMIVDNFADEFGAEAASARLLAELKTNPPRTIAFKDPEMRSALAAFPLPSGAVATAALPLPGPPPAAMPSAVSFVESADRLGIRFQYVNSDDSSQPGTPIYHQLGGGIGSLDFDRDGWPDLYLSQGARWPPSDQNLDLQDKLFHNRGGDAFIDVTRQAGLGDTRYSQGVAAGDLNNDGFPDLYVANIGGNRLYLNQGDGTFSEVQGEFTTRSDWSTSCAIADISGDGNPDIFVVNYLDGREPFELVCRGGKSCTPGHFLGQQDQLYLSQGDGTFQRVSDEAGIVAGDGKGLGVVIADFDNSGRLSIFISNDTTANHFYVPRSGRGDVALKMEDQGMLAGLAYDRDGLAQACMGIGIDDADNDSRLDLFVTNFYNESNTLYRQVGTNLFVDDTRDANLRTPSLTKLGFGTQFLDADSDGNSDLVVTNGHVDDYRDTGADYKMPPQFFRNLGNGRYEELPAAGLGPYFQGAYLGRSLAKSDFNRDGRPDFAVLHLDAPLALLVNQTATNHHSLTLHLVGVNCDRDAIGTQVTIETDAGTWHKQLTAGDGYQASNQRVIHAGLGKSDVIRQLTVRWPHGAEQTFANVPADQEWLAVEGRAELVAVPH